MDVLINTANNVDGHADFAAGIEENVRRRLARFENRLTRVEVYMDDTNSTQKGGADKSCRMEARPKSHEPVTVSSTSESFEHAASAALSKLGSALEHTFGKMSDAKGH